MAGATQRAIPGNYMLITLFAAMASLGVKRLHRCEPDVPASFTHPSAVERKPGSKHLPACQTRRGALSNVSISHPSSSFSPTSTHPSLSLRKALGPIQFATEPAANVWAKCAAWPLERSQSSPGPKAVRPKVASSNLNKQQGH